MKISKNAHGSKKNEQNIFLETNRSCSKDFSSRCIFSFTAFDYPKTK